MNILIDGPDQVLYQWDTGQRLRLHGYDAGTRVDFVRRKHQNKAASKYAYSEGEAVFCDIPDVLLMDPTHLHGYVYEIDGDRGETVREFMIPVIRRPMPEDYVEPGDPATPSTVSTVEIASVVALKYGEAPTVTETEDSTPQARKYVLGIPAGPKGEAGVSIFAAHVTTGDATTIKVHRDEIEQRYDKPGIDDLLLTDDAKLYIVTGLGKDSSNAISYYFAKFSSSIRGPAGPAGSGGSLNIDSDGNGNVTISASAGTSITSDGAGNVTIA